MSYDHKTQDEVNNDAVECLSIAKEYAASQSKGGVEVNELTDEEIDELANANPIIAGWREFDNCDNAESSDMKKVFKAGYKAKIK